MAVRRALLIACLFASVPVLSDAANGQQAVSSLCGRPGYPDADSFDASAVANASLWRSFGEAGGFDGGVEGRGAVELPLFPEGGTVRRVRLEEVTVRQYTGGSDADVVLLALRVEATVGGDVVAAHDFTLVSTGGRAGGNLTLVARSDGGALDVFWRWAYLPCIEDGVNAYYVFHAQIEGNRIKDDNTLVYFEAPRPRRGPPADLVLLITAGVAVSVIFLLARRALRRRP